MTPGRAGATTGVDRLRREARLEHLGGQAVRISSVGDGPPLLLCNGLASPLEAWGPFAEVFAGHRLIVFDAPGVGDSPPPVRPLGIGGVARLAAAVLDRVGAPRAHVLGYSWGSAVAQHLAWRHADRVDRLVLAAGSAGMGSVPGAPIAVLAMMVGTMAVANPRRPRTSPLGFAGQIGAIGTWSSLPWLHRVRARTLVVHGGADYVVPVVNAHVLAWALRDAQLEVLPRADHLLFEPRACGRVAASIRAFLAAP
jgi:pimeloyl-ACP methyl ester carboxylesterase